MMLKLNTQELMPCCVKNYAPEIDAMVCQKLSTQKLMPWRVKIKRPESAVLVLKYFCAQKFYTQNVLCNAQLITNCSFNEIFSLKNYTPEIFRTQNIEIFLL